MTSLVYIIDVLFYASFFTLVKYCLVATHALAKISIVDGFLNVVMFIFSAYKGFVSN